MRSVSAVCLKTVLYDHRLPVNYKIWVFLFTFQITRSMNTTRAGLSFFSGGGISFVVMRFGISIAWCGVWVGLIHLLLKWTWESSFLVITRHLFGVSSFLQFMDVTVWWILLKRSFELIKGGGRGNREGILLGFFKSS